MCILHIIYTQIYMHTYIYIYILNYLILPRSMHGDFLKMTHFSKRKKKSKKNKPDFLRKWFLTEMLLSNITTCSCMCLVPISKPWCTFLRIILAAAIPREGWLVHSTANTTNAVLIPPLNSSACLEIMQQYFDLSAPIKIHILADLKTDWISDAECK